MRRTKRILVIAGVIIGLSAITALYIYKEYNRTHKDTAELTPDFSIKAEQLMKEFENDEQSSNGKYWNKVIQVTGVKEFDPEGKLF